jgi:hypothetical protein
MKFAIFGVAKENSVFVNPATVRYVKSINDSSCRVYFDSEQNIVVPLPASLVCEDLEKANRANQD